MKSLILAFFALTAIVMISGCTDLFQPPNNNTSTCKEEWRCAAWSNCINGGQTRVCTDSNNCGTTKSKPTTSQSCTCIENWTCTNWSVCENNDQARTCADENACGTSANKPVEQQTCQPLCDGAPCKDGVVVISASSSGKAYANQIANERNWGFTEVQSSDIDSVKSVIKNFYDKNHNNYLLIIGTNDEIPFAKPRTGYTEESSEIGSYDTDPSLYADVNNDGFIEMSVGRIPFSSDSELRTYFSDLAPKGGNYYFEHYNFAHDGNDSLDESTVRQFTYATCLKSITPSLSVYRQSGFADLVNHYKTATLLQVSAHGSNNLFAIDDPYNDFYINSLCADCRKLESASDPQCGCAAPQYLSNRPILIHLSCNNAKELGLQLIQNGASAFVGAYVQSGGTPPSMSESILSGMSVGDAFKNMYNGQIVSEATFNMEPGYNPTIVNIDGLNNFDFASLMMHSNPNCQILYGDPSLKLSSPPTSRQSIGIKKTPNQIIIDVSPAAMFDMTAKDSLLCYSSPYLQAPTFINKDYWGSGTNFGASHKIYLAIPVKGVNQIINTTAIVNNNELVLPNKKEGQIYYGEYRVNLVKGLSEGFLYLDINDPALDYNKNIKIMISYV